MSRAEVGPGCRETRKHASGGARGCAVSADRGYEQCITTSVSLSARSTEGAVEWASPHRCCDKGQNDATGRTSPTMWRGTTVSTPTDVSNLLGSIPNGWIDWVRSAQMHALTRTCRCSPRRAASRTLSARCIVIMKLPLRRTQGVAPRKTHSGNLSCAEGIRSLLSGSLTGNSSSAHTFQSPCPYLHQGVGGLRNEAHLESRRLIYHYELSKALLPSRGRYLRLHRVQDAKGPHQRRDRSAGRVGANAGRRCGLLRIG